jgi:hypothetical protein
MPVHLEPGVREVTSGSEAPAAWYTTRLEFDRAAGWDRQRAEEWVQRYLGARPLGRTGRLDVPRRMQPPLAAFLSEVLFDGAYRLAIAASGSRDGPGAASLAVEFVPVPAPLDIGSRRHGLDHRARSNGARARIQAPAQPARGGAGLELDLASARHTDRLPGEVRRTLPERGLVNYLEAQAVVRTLEGLAKDSAYAATALVLALYPAQAELIRQLIRRSPLLSIWKEGLDVEVAGAVRHREAPVVLVSLTRSHSHRAVSFGEEPNALALAMTRAQERLILFGDPGTLARRGQWEGPLDHLDEIAAGHERKLVNGLLRYVQGQGCHPQLFHLCEGSRA